MNTTHVLPLPEVDHIEALSALQPKEAGFVESIQAQMDYAAYTQYCSFLNVDPVNPRKYQFALAQYPMF